MLTLYYIYFGSNPFDLINKYVQFIQFIYSKIVIKHVKLSLCFQLHDFNGYVDFIKYDIIHF